MDFLPTAYDAMLNGVVDINSDAAYPVRCGSSNLGTRKWLWIHNASKQPVFIGSVFLVSGVRTTITAKALGKNGLKMAAGDERWFPVTNNITVYARSNSGSARLRVMELG